MPLKDSSTAVREIGTQLVRGVASTAGVDRELSFWGPGASQVVLGNVLSAEKAGKLASFCELLNGNTAEVQHKPELLSRSS